MSVNVKDWGFHTVYISIPTQKQLQKLREKLDTVLDCYRGIHLVYLYFSIVKKKGRKALQSTTQSVFAMRCLRTVTRQESTLVNHGSRIISVKHGGMIYGLHDMRMC